jgi:hypothetical protein
VLDCGTVPVADCYLMGQYFDHAIQFVEAIWSHLKIIGVGAVIAALVAAMKKIRSWPWLQAHIGLSFDARARTLLNWIEKRRFGVAAFLLLLCLFIASFLSFAEQAEQLDALLSPKIDFVFDKDEDVIPPKDRKGYDNWAVRLEITTTSRLSNARLVLYSAAYKPDSKESFSTIAKIQTPITLYNWDASFAPTSIDFYRLYALFDTWGDGNKHLRLLGGGSELELDPLKDLKPGEYRFELVLSSDRKIGERRYAFVHWTGNMKDFEMTLRDKP